ncbi:MAG TPA: hypothetical protein VGK50_05390 [Coriobacteriia bacterium]
MLAVVRGLPSVRTHYAREQRELLRILLNAASAAEADFALHILRESMPEKELLAAVNIREVMRELPACPFPMAIDTETLVRITRLERDRSSWRREFHDECGRFDLVVLGDGNLCYDLLVSDGEHDIFWTPHPRNGLLIHPDALDLVMRRDALLQEVIGMTIAMGLPFSPTFYLSIDDWMLEYASEAMTDLSGLF